MKVIVLGGTGYLGRRITEALRDAGHDVSVASRGRLHPAILDRVEHIQVDRHDHVRFVQTFRALRFDAVVDNIVYDREDVRSAIAAFAGRTGQYLCTSSVAVYNRAGMTRPLRESDADLEEEPTEGQSELSSFHPTRGAAYGIAKRQAELELEQHGSELPFTTLRAPIVVGPDDRTLRIWWFVQRLLDGGPIIVPDWGCGHVFQVAYADDLARAFVAALGNPAALCHAYNIAQADVLSPESWIEGFAAALGAVPNIVRIPESLLAAADLAGYALPIAGRPFGHVLLDLSAARQDLGFEPTPFADWIQATAGGCAASPPAADSEGYARRADEIAVGRRFEELQQELYARFAAPP